MCRLADAAVVKEVPDLMHSRQTRVVCEVADPNDRLARVQNGELPMLVGQQCACSPNAWQAPIFVDGINGGDSFLKIFV